MVMKNVRVATVSFGRGSDREATLQRALSLVERAGEGRPDIIALPEACVNDRTTAETVPGPLSDLFAAQAQKRGCYVILPLIRREDDGTLYNVAVLLDPAGKVAGEYKKMFPTDGEIRDGIIPGETTPVFDTPFGRIGMSICFDLNFPEVIQGLSAQGAELVFFLSAYEGGRQLQRWALDYGVYMVSSHRGGVGIFVDKTGHVLQKGDPNYHPIVLRDLNMDRYIFHLDNNWKKFQAMIAKYGSAIHIDVCRPEAFFALESRSPEVSVADLAREFELETFKEYMQRSRECRTAALNRRPTT
jgi:predicted amidohydrolase